MLIDVDSRELLGRWRRADISDALAIEEELARRGFGQFSQALVDKLLSDNAEDRLRLVDEVLADPAAGARAWLSLMAVDEHAEVRLLVLTIIATSSDRALLEQAWQAAIHDRDPRVAGLAPRLKERREAARLR
jgi:hypothetical protein